MMNEEELCLKVQKNWIRIKHETHSIRDRLMDKLLTEGALSVEQIKDIKCRPREEQFDFCLYSVIESRQCKVLLRVLEMYGRRPLCIAIRKTEINDGDYNTSTHLKLVQTTQINYGARQQLFPPVKHADARQKQIHPIKDVQTVIDQTDEQLNEQTDEFKEQTGSCDAKPATSVIKKKVTKKKGKTVSHREEARKVKDENDRLKTITRAKSDEVSKLRAQLDARTEEVKWLKAQVEDRDSRQRNQASLLRKSQDEKLNLQKRLRDSKKEQLELTNKLMDKELKEKDSEGTPSDVNTLVSLYGKKADRTCHLGNIKDKAHEEPSDGKKKHVRFEYKERPVESKMFDQTIHDMQHVLKNAIEERECVNRLLKLENTEVLKLTVAIRTKTEENENLWRQMQDIESPVVKMNNKIRINDFEIRDAKDNLEKHMKDIEELTERLKPITLQVNEIKERLRSLEQN